MSVIDGASNQSTLPDKVSDVMLSFETEGLAISARQVAYVTSVLRNLMEVQ